jgi:hypothetical protein
VLFSLNPRQSVCRDRPGGGSRPLEDQGPCRALNLDYGWNAAAPLPRVAMVDRMTEGQVRQLHTTFLLLDGAASLRWQRATARRVDRPHLPAQKHTYKGAGGSRRRRWAHRRGGPAKVPEHLQCKLFPARAGILHQRTSVPPKWGRATDCMQARNRGPGWCRVSAVA